MNRVEAARELDVPLRATAAEVEHAFRHAARRSHPDLGGDAQAFRRVAEARATMLRPPPPDPFLRVVEVVVRYHPAIRALTAVARALDPRSAPRPRG